MTACDTKCLVCDTPTILLVMTSRCGTTDRTVVCPFAVPGVCELGGDHVFDVVIRRGDLGPQDPHVAGVFCECGEEKPADG